MDVVGVSFALHNKHKGYFDFPAGDKPGFGQSTWYYRGHPSVSGKKKKKNGLSVAATTSTDGVVIGLGGDEIERKLPEGKNGSGNDKRGGDGGGGQRQGGEEEREGGRKRERRKQRVLTFNHPTSQTLYTLPPSPTRFRTLERKFLKTPRLVP
ncbi:hypothetical protein ONZ45_g16345 [Pleurotus djamor]|nr:hypothetical protein ONZ45_g16345 [Pleurotus djamor]